MQIFAIETEEKITEGYGLSPQQQHLWLLQKTEKTGEYLAQCAVSISGTVNLSIFKSALQKIVERHEIFRTSFDSLPGMIVGVQVIGDGNIFWDREWDLTQVESTQKMAELEKVWSSSIQRDFDLKKDSLFHASLVKISPEQQTLLITLPALIADSKSLQILVWELEQEYVACLEGNDLPEAELQYADIAEWQNQLIAAEEAKLGKEFWQKQEISNRFNFQLPFEKQSEEFQPKVHEIIINSDLTAKIKNIAKQLENSISDFFLTCWLTLIWRLTGKLNLVVGLVGDGRQYEDLEPALGLFAKYLPFSFQVQEDLKFNELLEQVKASISDVLKWQDYFTWEQFIPPTENYSRLSFIPLAFDFIELNDISQHVDFKIDRVYTCTDKYKIKLVITQNRNLSAEFHYDANAYNADDIQRLTEQFQILLASVVENPVAEISKLKINASHHLQQLLLEFNNTQKTYPQEQCIHQLFEEQVQKNPDAIAVVFEQQQLTYQQLNAKGNQLAHYLQNLGVKPETLVGICLERSIEIVVGLLGVLKAGGAYIPLDPKLPPENLNFKLQDTNAPVILTKKYLVQSLPKSGRETICLDSDWDKISQESTENPTSEVTPSNLIYLIYTSGSTGKQKGVAVEHQQLINYLHSIYDKLENTQQDIIATYAIISTFAADLGNTVIFPSLCFGGCLHIISEELVFDGEALADYCNSYPIDYLKIVPSHLGSLLSSSCPEKILPRQQLILGGEALSWELIEQIQKSAPDCQIINHYGPSETTVGVTTFKLGSSPFSSCSQTVPLGRPLANQHIYILDKNQQPVPIGVPGELHIGGVGLARGYLNRPKLTAEKFIPNPFDNKNSKLYKTGDLARYLPDGNIEYLGRIDNQVKIRGFRIELGEIETVLNQHPAIQQSVAIVREDRPGDRRLVAYFVSIDGTSNSNNNFGQTATNIPEKPLPVSPNSELESELRRFLAEKLPDYMIPMFVPLKTLPLTPNGKVDRRSLPAPESVQSGSKANKFVAARTPEEKLLADIYAEVLGISQVSIYDNFFQLGGHSLTAMQLVSNISTAMNISLSLQNLLSHPTIAELTDSIAELLENKKSVQANELQKTLNESNQEPVSQKKSEFIQVESRSLLSLFSVGKIPPVDAASLGCLDESELATSGLSRDYVIENIFENLPLLRSVRETNCGRIAGIILPQFSSELYSDQDALVSKIIEALEMAARIGAKFVSLTGLIPSATDYGRAITKAIVHRQDWPKITTGHGTTGAAVILTIKKVCEESRRDLSGEKVGFLGLGSVGMNVLSLMLKCLPHPQEITLCDVYSKLDFMENIKQELVKNFGFKGQINLALSTTVVPPEIYNSTLIVGATNVANVLDIIQVKSGTIIVDDSAPHCFAPELAIQRFQEHGDILFTEGGVLRSPVPIHSLIYFPPHIAKLMNDHQKEKVLNPNPFNIMGCAFSSLLSSQFEQLQPTVGFVDGQHSQLHDQALQELGFEAGDLHCGEYVLSKESIVNFRQCFGKL